MKQLLLLATLMFTLLCSAQTPIIAHKSHSASRMSFFIDPNSNFGQIVSQPRAQKPVVLELNESFQPVNDTTVVKLTTDDNNMLIRIDTISKKENETIEQVKEKHSSYPKPLKKQNSSMEGGKRKNEIIVSTPPRNTKTPPFLFIFVAVSVIGMVLYRIFFSGTSVQLNA